MKILIIDDSYEIRDVLRLIIERHNHEVVGGRGRAGRA